MLLTGSQGENCIRKAIPSSTRDTEFSHENLQIVKFLLSASRTSCLVSSRKRSEHTVSNIRMCTRKRGGWIRWALRRGVWLWSSFYGPLVGGSDSDRFALRSILLVLFRWVQDNRVHPPQRLQISGWSLWCSGSVMVELKDLGVPGFVGWNWFLWLDVWGGGFRGHVVGNHKRTRGRLLQ